MGGRCASLRHHGAVTGPRVIVVGAGVYGLAAARRLALRGAHVTVLEAREAGGPFAASAGSSRVLRFEYGPDTHYTELVLRARKQWRELERLLGETLYEETGVLWFADEESRYLHDSLQTSLAAGLPVRLLEPAEAVRRFPAFSAEGIAVVLHDEAGGVLHARRATLALARLARAAGATVREGVAVRAVGNGYVELAGGVRELADQVLVTTGAWTRGLLPARRSARPSRSTSTCACEPRACRSGSTTSTSTGSATTPAPASRWAGMPSAPTSIPTIPRRARLPPPRCAGSPTRRAGACRACPGPPPRLQCEVPTCAATP